MRCAASVTVSVGYCVARWWVFDLWVWVWVSASQSIPLSVFARNPHKGLAREISYEIGRRRGKARSQSIEQRRVSDRQGKVTVRERQLLKKELGLVGPEAGSASVPGSCVGISFGYTLAIATDAQKCQKSVKNFYLLTLRVYPSPRLFVLLSYTLGYICYICCIFVKHVKCPWPETRKTTRLSNGYELI